MSELHGRYNKNKVKYNEYKDGACVCPICGQTGGAYKQLN